MLDKAALLRIVAAEVDSVGSKKPKKQSKPKEDTTWKKLVKAFNDASILKYRVALATGEAFKLKATANKILATFGGDLELAIKVIDYYVEHYEEFPFVSLSRFQKPLFGSVSPFAPKILEYMETRGQFVAAAEKAHKVSLQDSATALIVPGLEDAF